MDVMGEGWRVRISGLFSEIQQSRVIIMGLSIAVAAKRGDLAAPKTEQWDAVAASDPNLGSAFSVGSNFRRLFAIFEGSLSSKIKRMKAGFENSKG